MQNFMQILCKENYNYRYRLISKFRYLNRNWKKWTVHLYNQAHITVLFNSKKRGTRWAAICLDRLGWERERETELQSNNNSTTAVIILIEILQSRDVAIHPHTTPPKEDSDESCLMNLLGWQLMSGFQLQQMFQWQSLHTTWTPDGKFEAWFLALEIKSKHWEECH